MLLVEELLPIKLLIDAMFRSLLILVSCDVRSVLRRLIDNETRFQ